MGDTKRPRVLCVDDEARVVEGLTLHLRRDYEVHTAGGGAEGLQMLKERGTFAVVISDMRMPEMDGATFLHRVKRTYPDTTRILLTGETGREAAVNAVNEGQIFRFLTKPCPPEQLKAAVDAGVMQHRLMNVERQILQETLIGCIEAMIDVLALTNPVAFGRATRIKRTALQFWQSLGTQPFWQLEAAAMLSQLGYLSLPVELVEKLYFGEQLTAEEEVLAQGVPATASKLLGHIPRLDSVLQILDAIHANDKALAALGEGTIGTGARILMLVLDYDALVTQGHSKDVAMQTLRLKSARYGGALLEKFAAFVGATGATAEVRVMALRQVQPGMTILDDLRTHMGTLLVPRGFEVSEPFLEKLRNFGPSALAENVKVLVPAALAVDRR